MRKLFFVFLVLSYQLSVSQISKNIDLLSNWNDTSLTPNTSGSRYNEVWGIVQNNREYAIVGSTYGTHIIDVTDPTNAHEVQRAAGAFQGNSVIHRDYHDYKGYLYAVCDEGQSSLQIFDLKYLPDSLPKVYDGDILFSRAHNIFIDAPEKRLYACGTTFNAMGIYSLENPEKPELIANYTGLPYVHDIYVRYNIGYVNCPKRGFYIVDFNDPKNPTTYTSLTSYPDKGYNHSGWLNETGEIYVLCDETKGKKVKVYDVSDVKNIKLKSTLTSGVSDSSMAHNVIIKNKFAYISYYDDGLQIFDISNPAQPVKTGYYDTFTAKDSADYRGAWGIYPLLPSGNVLVSDMKTGLYVFDAVKASTTNVNVQDNSVDQVKIYPNPFSSNITVDISVHKNQKLKIGLYDINGRQIESFEKSILNNGQKSYQFNLEQYKSDSHVHFLKVILDKDVRTYKLLKSQ